MCDYVVFKNQLQSVASKSYETDCDVPHYTVTVEVDKMAGGLQASLIILAVVIIIMTVILLFENNKINKKIKVYNNNIA